MVGDLYLRIGAVILTVLIAIVPIWYPRYSFFRRHASNGLDRLTEINEKRESEEGTDNFEYYSTLEIGDDGFKELCHTITHQTEFDRRPVKIELIHINPESGPGSLVLGERIKSGQEAKVVVEFESGKQDVLIPSPNFEMERVLNLSSLREMVRHQANRRSHYWTTVLAIIWGTISLLLIV